MPGFFIRVGYQEIKKDSIRRSGSNIRSLRFCFLSKKGGTNHEAYRQIIEDTFLPAGVLPGAGELIEKGLGLECGGAKIEKAIKTDGIHSGDAGFFQCGFGQFRACVLERVPVLRDHVHRKGLPPHHQRGEPGL
jgi:hypothetical protein